MEYLRQLRGLRPLRGLCVHAEWLQSRPTCWAPLSWDSPGKGTGVGCYFLLQGIFPTQGLNPGLPHCRRTLYRLSHSGSQELLEEAVFESQKMGSSCHWGWGGVGRGGARSSHWQDILASHLPRRPWKTHLCPKKSPCLHTETFFFLPHIKKFPFYTGFSIWTCFFDHLILGHKKIICLFLPTA